MCRESLSNCPTPWAARAGVDSSTPMTGARTPSPVVPRGPLCWLHLSDLHVQGTNWEQDVVCKALLRDLPGLLQRAQRQPQLLFVTGDVANRGDKREYDGAFRLLDELCGALGLARERDVFLV